MTRAVSPAALPEQMLEFTLGEERYCVGIDGVEEIVKAEDVTPLPNTPSEVAGVMDLRGQTTTILDPTAVFDIDAPQSSQQVVVFDSDQRVGWLVDRVHRVNGFQDADVNAVPDSPNVSGVISDDGQFTIWVEPHTVNESVSLSELQ